MKMRKVINILLVSLVLIVILFSYIKRSGVIKSDNLFTKLFEKQANEITKGNLNIEDNQELVYEDNIENNKISKFFYGAEISDMNSAVMADGYQYKVNNVEVTKEIGEFENPEWPHFEYDDNGNLTNEYSYAVIDITIDYKEVVYEDLEVYLNNMTLNIFSDDGDFKNRYEVVSSNNNIKFSQKNHFKIDLATGESITRKIVFIVDDKELNNNFVLFIDNHGVLGQNIEDQKCIMLDLEE